jgi:glycosyltransferase involved in cell wall biosynthesis
MKVAMYAPTGPRCGIADYTRRLIDALPADIEIDVVPADGATSAEHYRAQARRLNDADVAHLQYEHGFFLGDDAPARNVAAFLRELRVPRLVTLHSLPLDDPLWHESLAAAGTLFLVHSGHQVSLLPVHAARGRVEVCPLPAPRRSGGTRSAHAFRAAHGLGGRVVLSIFGFTKPHKGYETALSALRRLPDEVVLVVAGGPQDEMDRRHLERVRLMAEALGVAARLRVTGYLDGPEVGAAMQASDLVLAPFASMTASASIATALAWERPLLASDLPQTRELAARFGCPLLCARGDAAALAGAVERVLADGALRHALQRAARAYRGACTYSHLAATTVALYGRLRRPGH